ncbi:protein spt2 isoform X2 [Raphanus sativus]|uniref:Protein spt2 isoform X2 n=1 Tax=Raphanus sativus TaxID=3726 RepID=A0A6J0K2S4_RAPSA|nr:protein spt2 isoform X2 [Raphanus sativus]
MQAYEEDLDEEAGYDDYYSDDNGLDEYEEEEEEEEVPPKEELEYLELRQKIKESIRKKSGKGSVSNNAPSSQDRRKKLPYNDFGSFFGPSRPVISSRVIQESKSLLENEIKNSNQPKKRPVPASSSGDRNVSHEKKRPKVVSATRRKVETLKDTRDYSFLFSDDADLPAPKKEPLSRSGSFPNSEARSAQSSARPKQSPAINGRVAQGPPREDKRPANGHSRPASSGSQMNHSRPGSSGSQMPNSRPTTTSSGSQMQSRSISGRPASSGSSQMQKSRPASSGSQMQNSRPGNQMQQRASSSGSQRPGSSANRQAPMRPPSTTMNSQSANRNGQPSSRSAPAKVPVDHRRQMSSSSNGVGPGRSGSTATRPLSSKPSLERKPSMSAGKSSLQSAQRPPSSSRPMASDPRQRLGEQRKVNPTTSRMIPKQPVPTSRHQMMSKPAAKRPPQRDMHDDRRPLKKKKPAIMSEDAKALSMIRQMFNTNRYAGRDDDDRNMEANFDDIMKEERRSARIAREEDEKEAQLIAAEEERERLRKIRKNR